MDPAFQQLITGLAPWVASGIGVITGLSALQQYTSGHDRQGHGMLVTTVVGGAIATGLAYTSPQWVPLMLSMMQSTRPL